MSTYGNILLKCDFADDSILTDLSVITVNFTFIASSCRNIFKIMYPNEDRRDFMKMFNFNILLTWLLVTLGLY